MNRLEYFKRIRGLDFQRKPSERFMCGNTEILKIKEY